MLRRLLTLESEHCELVFELEDMGALLVGSLVSHGEDWKCLLSPEEVICHLNGRGVENIDEAALRRLVKSARDGLPAGRTTVAEGKRATPPRDGFLEFRVTPHCGRQALREDEHGDVDFHQEMTIATTQPGETVARVVPPFPGEDGRSVTGATIKAGEASSARYSLGRGVVVAGDILQATEEGRLIFENGEVSVSNEYIVEGNVDATSGNIRFKGIVTIRGDVTDGYKVEANMGITVTGVIGAADISTDGSIACLGISGHGKAKLKAAGDIGARYVSGAHISCSNLRVENELYNSTVYASGTVEVSKGSIVGGEVIAIGGIDTHAAGSEAGVRTSLAAGTSYGRLAELAALRSELEQLSGLSASAAASEEDITSQRAELKKRIKALLGEREPGSRAEITVRRQLYDNVEVRLEPYHLTVPAQAGPILLKGDEELRTIAVTEAK